jgi:hypothetical protein
MPEDHLGPDNRDGERQLMKKAILAISLFMMAAVTVSAQTAPVGYCKSDVAQTISNGVIAPVPFAAITLCSAGSTATTCAANIVQIYTTNALTTRTETNPFTADVGGNYFFCAPVGHYAQLISGSQGTFFIPDTTFVDDWSLGGNVNGIWKSTSVFITSLATSSPHCLQAGVLGSITATTFPCGNSNSTGTVTNVAIGPGWPSWLTPNVSNPGTTPSINATVAPIPNAALANPAVTVNGTVCTLGASCTLGTNRTCNSNGCYTVGADGTIEEWGTLTVSPSGAVTNTATITFPTAFTTSPSVVITGEGVASSSGDTSTPPLWAILSKSTSGASLFGARVIVAGAGGGNFDNTMFIDWHAIGN